MKKHKFKTARFLTLLVFITLPFLFTACSEEGLRGPGDAAEISAFEQIQAKLIGLENFRAIATVEYHSNKGTNTYETIQHGRITGEYRVEVTGPAHVSGSVTANDGSQIIQFNSRVNGRVNLMTSESPERSEILLTSFIKNYLQSYEVSVSVADMDAGVRTVFEAIVPGNHPYLATQKLWVDNNTLLPVKLIIFDPDGAERIVVTYHVFEYNVAIEDSLFTL